MRAAAGLHADDPLLRQRLHAVEDQRILPGVDVVGDDGDRIAVAHRLAEHLHKRRLARADGAADADAQRAVRGTHVRKSLVCSVSWRIDAMSAATVALPRSSSVEASAPLRCGHDRRMERRQHRQPGALAERHEADGDGDEVRHERVEESGKGCIRGDLLVGRRGSDRHRIGRAATLPQRRDRGRRPGGIYGIEEGAALRHRLQVPLAPRRQCLGEVGSLVETRQVVGARRRMRLGEQHGVVPAGAMSRRSTSQAAKRRRRGDRFIGDRLLQPVRVGERPDREGRREPSRQADEIETHRLAAFARSSTSPTAR